jgi:hypothetical protein
MAFPLWILGLTRFASVAQSLFPEEWSGSRHVRTTNRVETAPDRLERSSQNLSLKRSVAGAIPERIRDRRRCHSFRRGLCWTRVNWLRLVTNRVSRMRPAPFLRLRGLEIEECLTLRDRHRMKRCSFAALPQESVCGPRCAHRNSIPLQ